MTATRTKESPAATPGTLPEWPLRTIAVLATLADEGPHAIPVSAPIRADDRRILLNLHRTRDSLGRLRRRPRVALTILAADNIAFTARGTAHVIQEPMSSAPDYVAISIAVDEIDDHRQPAFLVEAGPDRRWVDDAERDALGQRIRSLTTLATC
jgi:pyridoxamine 5'-phosphate oxidase-like protein